MSDETTLLPCPFCGGEARMLGTKERWFNPACSNAECGCEWTDSYATEAEAIAAWNARAERTCHIGVRRRMLMHQYWNECVCDECRVSYWMNETFFPMPNYCPNCGRRVVT